ncbi:MAG TPA: alpha/beta hydrolase [Puia sp.]|nr:alpha/beta hydrolase [Puia sp.]
MEDVLTKINEDRVGFNGLGFIYPVDASVKMTTEDIEGVKCYWFEPGGKKTNNLMFYLHGGMFVLGSIDGYRAMISHFAAAFPAKILFIEYGLAPENPFPVGINEILKVYQAVIPRFPEAKFFVMGDSAGGALAATLVKMASDKKLQMPSGVVLMSPWIYLRGNTESYETRKLLDPILTKEKLVEYGNYYVGNHWDEADPGEFEYKSFPPLLILVGTNEILHDDSKLFYGKIKSLQPEIQLKEYENQIHGWPLMDINSDAAKDALASIKLFIAKTGG